MLHKTINTQLISLPGVLLLLLLLLLPLSACFAPDGPFILETRDEANTANAGSVEGEALAAGDAQIEVTEVEMARVEEAGGNVGEDEVAVEDVALEETLARATFLLGIGVEDTNGEELGVVDDFIVDIETGQIIYVILDRSKLLGLVGDHRPLPLATLEWNPALKLMFSAPPELLSSVPTVGDDWPVTIEQGWDAGIFDFWQAEGELIERKAETVPARLSDLIGMHAGGLGENLAIVEDFLIDLDEGRSKYVALFDYDGFYDQNLVLILPLSTAELDVEVVDEQSSYGIALLAVDAQTLAEAPTLDRSLFLTIDLVGVDFAEELRAYWEEHDDANSS